MRMYVLKSQMSFTNISAFQSQPNDIAEVITIAIQVGDNEY